MSIIFVIGPTCAGKSTYIKEHYSGYKVVDLFDFQKDLRFFTIEDIFESYKKCENALIDALKNNENVVLEHTLLKAKRRKPYIDAVRSITNGDIEIVVIKPSRKELEKRAKKRGVEFYKGEVDSFEELFEMPTLDEGFSKITVVE